MRLFECPSCRAAVTFTNTACLSCGNDLVFDIEREAFVSGADPCKNRSAIGCNWKAGAGEASLCWSCAMTAVIPDTFHGENVSLWAESESAKRQVLATLGRWGWFTPSDTGQLPVFHMLSEATSRGPSNVVMAHDRGTITINVMEADIVERVERRENLGEKLRTMVGHFRHEIAHFLFERLSEHPEFVKAFRALMGDEREDYGEALKRYYENGPPANWEQNFVTAYASSHPHEDWAESVTHILHLTDMIDCAVAMKWQSPHLTDMTYDPYKEADGERIVELGSYFGMAVNHINRSVGVGDIYPFVLNDAVRGKLAFVHSWLSGHAQKAA